MEVIQLTFPSFSCAIHQQAKAGNDHCGDSYFAHESRNYFVISIADGLGSGLEAKQASQLATSLMEQCHHLPVTDVVSEINRELNGTRGVVFAVAKFFPEENRAEFSGVGNIMFTLYPVTGKRIRTLSLPGYLDGRNVRVRKEDFPYTPGDSFVMYSDGISPRAEWADVFREVGEPLEGLDRIKQMWKLQNDDITVIVGR